jgi:two-component system catabolic regulation response regulator CreB
MTARILVVEDEPAIAESVAYALRRDGFFVTQAGTLAEAEARHGEADLVILDLMLPDGSGFDFIGAVRAERSGKPVIVLSSRDGELDRVAALETGADDYVTKPFSPREVVARVRAVLRRVSGAADPAPAAASIAIAIAIDTATRRARVGTSALELTRIEFDLLAYLLEGADRVCTRSELIDKLWGDGFAITDRTIDSHVKALRKKLAEAGAPPGSIETVRGVGYRVNAHAGKVEEP